MLSGVAALLLVALAAAGCDDDSFRPVLPPGARADTFQQIAAARVDVLFVVDNSPSMIEEQENLGRNFRSFFEHLVRAGADYHIGVTTTDVYKDNGRLQGSPEIITRDTPDPLAAFASNVKVGTEGTAREKGLEAARRTMELRPEGFLRDDAWLFFIFVSDEDDNSEPGTPRFFYRYFKGLKGKGNDGMVGAGAIVGDRPGGCIGEDGNADAAYRYAETVQMMGGQVGSICDPQFDRALKEMGVDAVGLRRKFTLSRAPDLETLTVTVRLSCDTARAELDAICEERTACASGNLLCTVRPLPENGTDGWTYEFPTNSLVFHGSAIPPRGAQVEAVYFEPGGPRP